jgi:SOS response regulatory protein OraA/RecX
MISLWMKEDLTYWQIAQKILEAQGSNLDDDNVRKKAAALRKQFTRPETGSLERFAVIYMKILAENGFEFEMIENMPILKLASSKYIC